MHLQLLQLTPLLKATTQNYQLTCAAYNPNRKPKPNVLNLNLQMNAEERQRVCKFAKEEGGGMGQC